MSKFGVGDRVLTNCPSDKNFHNLPGTIIEQRSEDPLSFRVRLDKPPVITSLTTFPFDLDELLPEPKTKTIKMTIQRKRS